MFVGLFLNHRWALTSGPISDGADRSVSVSLANIYL
jgi:hypothetical protein